MKRKLPIQILRQWRSNIWLAIELAVICTLLWAIAYVVIQQLRPVFDPQAFDISDVYVAYFDELDETHPQFVPRPEGETVMNDVDRLVTRLSLNPNVEAIGYGDNALPYKYSFYGTFLRGIVADDTIKLQINQRYLSPGMARVLRLRDIEGKQIDLDALSMQFNDFLASPYVGLPADTLKMLVGSELWSGSNTDRRYRLRGVIQNFKRSDFERAWASSAIRLFIPDDEMPTELAVRVLSGHGQEFLQSLRTDDFISGNLSIGAFKSMTDVRAAAQMSETQTLRNFAFCAAFLFICVLLGLFGTFWLRIGARTSEIAIRIAHGATPADIFRRLLAEGFIILGVAFTASAAMDAYLFHFAGQLESFPYRSDVSVALWGGAITLICVALITFIGVVVPARKAMTIDPALALKSE